MLALISGEHVSYDEKGKHTASKAFHNSVESVAKSTSLSCIAAFLSPRSRNTSSPIPLRFLLTYSSTQRRKGAKKGANTQRMTENHTAKILGVSAS